jgi:hypothetical protein
MVLSSCAVARIMFVVITSTNEMLVDNILVSMSCKAKKMTVKAFRGSIAPLWLEAQHNT